MYDEHEIETEVRTETRVEMDGVEERKQIEPKKASVRNIKRNYSNGIT